MQLTSAKVSAAHREDLMPENSCRACVFWTGLYSGPGVALKPNPVVMFVVSQLFPCLMCRLLPGARPKGRTWRKLVESIPRAIQDRLLLAPGRRWPVQGLQNHLCGDCLCPCSTGCYGPVKHNLPFLLFYLSPFTYRGRKESTSWRISRGAAEG